MLSETNSREECLHRGIIISCAGEVFRIEDIQSGQRSRFWEMGHRCIGAEACFNAPIAVRKVAAPNHRIECFFSSQGLAPERTVSSFAASSLDRGESFICAKAIQ